MLGAHLMPAFLDFKARTTSEVVDADCYDLNGAPKNEKVALEENSDDDVDEEDPPKKDVEEQPCRGHPLMPTRKWRCSVCVCPWKLLIGTCEWHCQCVSMYFCLSLCPVHPMLHVIIISAIIEFPADVLFQCIGLGGLVSTETNVLHST